VNEDALAVDVQEAVGPGGNFVTEEHTVEHMMGAYFYPSLCVRSNFDIWDRDGRPSMLTRAKDEVVRLLDAGEEGLLPLDLVQDIERTFPELRTP